MVTDLAPESAPEDAIDLGPRTSVVIDGDAVAVYQDDVLTGYAQLMTPR